MRSTVALLAVALSLALAGCGGDDAEPGAPQGGAASRAASLILDFQPNAVHSGLYLAEWSEFDSDEGIDLTLRVPGESSDAPKLLRSGRVDFAVLDIHDLAIARERGFDLVGIAPIVNRPLAAVIAADAREVRRPRDLRGGTVGVTGLPSDDAVLDSVLRADGVDPSKVDRTNIGFESIAALSAGRVDAATAFWNVEGLALREVGVRTREFRVERFGAPRYPELVLVTERRTLEDEPELITSVREIVRRGYEHAARDPQAALAAMIAGTPSLERAVQSAQLRTLGGALKPVRPSPELLQEWADWDLEHGIVEEPIDVGAAFDFGS